MPEKKAYIVGAGPGSPEWVTTGARKIISDAGIIVGWELNFTAVDDLIKDKKVYLQNADNYLQLAREAADEARRSGDTVAIVRIGDPCISSGLDGLLDIFGDFNIEIIPGISSVQIAAAAGRINLDEAVIISYHEDNEPLEAKQSFMLEAFRRNRHLIILTGQMQRPDETARYLINHGVSEDTPALLGENLTLENEKITSHKLKEVASGQFSWLSVMVVKHGVVP
jgi:precorrin-6y C5,15-methyltransferase (decarboxylating) CbiE subunit